MTGYGDLLGDTGLFVLDRLDELGGRDPSDLGGVLVVGRQPGADELADRDAVVACRADILRNRESHFLQLRHAADVGKIIRIHDDGRRVGQLHQVPGRLAALLRIVEAALDDVSVVGHDAVVLQRPVETDQPLVGDGGSLAVYEGDSAVALANQVGGQRVGALHIVGHDAAGAVKGVIDGDDRQAARDQLDDPGIREIHVGDQDAVHLPVLTVLQIGHGLSADVLPYKGDVVAQPFRLGPGGIQDPGEVLVGQAGVHLIHKEDTDVMRSVGLELAGGCVGNIVHFPGRLPDQLRGLRRDVAVMVQRLADGGDGDAALSGDILDRNSPFSFFHDAFLPGIRLVKSDRIRFRKSIVASSEGDFNP